MNGYTPAEEHHRISGHFGDLVRGVGEGGWDRPAPVAGWTARDVVRHLVSWFPPFLHGGSGIELPAGPSVDVDPVAAWRTHAAGVQAVLDDPVTAEVTFSNPHTGELPVAVAIDKFYTGDVFLHAWDLARATGQDETLDVDKCAQMLSGMQQMESVIRGSGQYGAAVEVPADADVQTRLLGFIGRDPLGAGGR